VKLNQQNIFVRFILRTLDVITSLLAGYWNVKWDQDPYRKATEAQKRVSGLFMALFPIAFLIFSENNKLGTYIQCYTDFSKRMLFVFNGMIYRFFGWRTSGGFALFLGLEFLGRNFDTP